MSAPDPNLTSSAESQAVSVADILTILREGDVDVQGAIPWSSNYTFLVTVHGRSLAGVELTLPAIYKPRCGEAPLWDFPSGTLCLREMAAYLVSQMLGWPLIPPTVLRDGPHGLGTVQFYVECDLEANYFTFGPERRRELLPIALFDIVTNNADRKGGHCLLGQDGRIWAVDHGLTFHVQRKLRTVIWDFAGQPVPEAFLEDLEALRARLAEDCEERRALARLLAEEEIQAFLLRCERVLRVRRFPDPGPGRVYPWPPV